MMKTLKLLVYRHIDDVLLKRPLHENEREYRASKSVETALHQLVTRLQRAVPTGAGGVY